MTPTGLNGDRTVMHSNPVTSSEEIHHANSWPGTAAYERKEPGLNEPAGGSPWPNINADGTAALPEEVVQRNYYHDLFESSTNPAGKPSKQFSRLANLSIAYYQHNLKRMEVALRDNGGALDEVQLRSLRTTLHQYYTAVREAREMDRSSEEDDEFHKMGDRFGIWIARVSQVLIMPPLFALAVLKMGWRRLRGVEAMDGEVLGAVIYMLERSVPIAEKISRIVIAILGSATLLVPMIVLSYIESAEYRLMTICLFVVVLSVCLMLLLRLNTTELVGIVAAYTAVLIVYIGG